MKQASIVSLLAAALVLLVVADGHAQSRAAGRGGKDCAVQREPSGMIRGDRIPRGCVLPSAGGERYKVAQPRQWSTALGPCEQYSERIDYTPGAKYSVLTNGARICRPILEASDPANWPGGEDFESFNSEFGSSQRNFGSSRRHLGSTQRNFGSSRRHFGSTQRNFGRQPGKSGGG
jgi:hypothetical protein